MVAEALASPETHYVRPGQASASATGSPNVILLYPTPLSHRNTVASPETHYVRPGQARASATGISIVILSLPKDDISMNNLQYPPFGRLRVTGFNPTMTRLLKRLASRASATAPHQRISVITPFSLMRLSYAFTKLRV